MTSLRMTPKPSGSKLFARPLLAVILTMMLVGGPVSPAFAQDTPQNPPPAPAPKAAAAPVPISLGSAKYHFTRAPKPFPNLFAPYRPIKIETPGIVNSPRIEQLIHDNKLEISLQDAVELALENSVDIAVGSRMSAFSRRRPVPPDMEHRAPLSPALPPASTPSLLSSPRTTRC
jgi:hypothetical protein